MQRRGISPETWAAVDGPAGIDIGATTPQEIAVSVIAAITARRESVRINTQRSTQAPKEQAPKPVIEEATGTEAKGHCCHD
jgi:xanthine/CO dehydrogenase XdhC/CoxF family maturation factor